jgi:excisionase family DNA binding protein
MSGEVLMRANANIADWSTIRDVARRLDLSQPRAWRLVHEGRIVAVRTRLGWLVDPTSLEAYAAERARRATRKRVAC